MFLTSTVKEYLEFIQPDVVRNTHGHIKNIFFLDNSGNYVVGGEYSDAFIKLLILKNWDKFLTTGISSTQLWSTLAGVTSEGQLKFDSIGKQISYGPTMNNLKRTAVTNLLISNTYKNYKLTIGFILTCLMATIILIYFYTKTISTETTKTETLLTMSIPPPPAASNSAAKNVGGKNVGGSNRTTTTGDSQHDNYREILSKFYSDL